MAALQVELVSVERKVWSGTAQFVTARTTEGEIGVLPGHAPFLAALAEGHLVTIRQGGDAPTIVVAVHGGFLSVTEAGVTVLAEIAELSTDIDTARAQAALARARTAGDDPAVRRAEARLRAAGALV